MAEDTKRFRLEDMKVLTVGLVPRGANQRDFFLLKEENMSKEDQADVLDSEDIQDMLGEPETRTRFIDFLKGLVSGSDDAADEAADDEPVADDLDDEPVVKSDDEPVADDESVTDELPEVIVKELEQLRKARVQAEELAASNEELRQELIKANEERKVRAEDEERRVYLNKAREMQSLPEAPEKVAEALMVLAKADAEQGEFMETLLKSVDAALSEAGFYSEYGSTQTTEGNDDPMNAALEAVQKGDARSLADAYLAKVSKSEAETRIREHRQKIKRG